MGVYIYSALDWASEKGKNYMPALEAMAKQSTLTKLEIPTWYDLTSKDTSPVLAFFHPLLKVPKLFVCAKEEKGIEAIVGRLAEKDIKLGPGFSGEDLLARFSDFLGQVISHSPKDWFGIVRGFEQRYSAYALNISAVELAERSGIYFDLDLLNVYLAMRATDEYHRPDKKRKAYIRARLANKEPEKQRMLKPIEEVEEVPIVYKVPAAIDTDVDKAPEEIKEDEYGDPTDDYGNSVHFDEDGCPVTESEEIREDEYDYPVPEEDSMDPVDEEGRPID